MTNTFHRNDATFAQVDFGDLGSVGVIALVNGGTGSSTGPVASTLVGVVPVVNGGTNESTGAALARAWVKFDGTTMSVKGSFNVATVTSNGTGDYLVTFSNPFVSSNFVASLNAMAASNLGGFAFGPWQNSVSSTTFRILTTSFAGAAASCQVVNASFFGQ